MKKSVEKILKITVKILRALLYVLSAGHLCGCKHQDSEDAEGTEQSGN